VVPFTKDEDRLGHELKRMEPGDGGAADSPIAGGLFGEAAGRPDRRTYRRRTTTDQRNARSWPAGMWTKKRLVEQIGTSNTLVLSVTFSPSKALLLQ